MGESQLHNTLPEAQMVFLDGILGNNAIHAPPPHLTHNAIQHPKHEGMARLESHPTHDKCEKVSPLFRLQRSVTYFSPLLPPSQAK